MANQIINVIVNSKGAVTVARELDSIGASAKSTSTYLNGLRAVLASALTFSGAGQIIETIDNFISLQNRLKQVADASNTVSDSWTKLMAIANSSYATIDGTVNLYFRVAQAYKAWGESAKSAYEFTDLFQKSAALSGSTMQTTSQAVYQFGQALNKGKLDGDEFRAVLEGLPYVANIIQKSLGVTRAELYKMSKDGLITVDQIKAAFENAADTIRKDWGNITPTIGMALTVLTNNWTDFLGSIQTSTGIFSGFAYVILAVANNFTLLAIALTPVAVSLAFLAGRLGIGLVVLGLQDMYTALKEVTVVQWLFNAAVSANPYVIAVAALVAVIAAIVYFRNELGLTNEVLTSIWTTVTTVFTSMVSYFAPIVTAVANVVKWFTQWNVLFVAIRAVASITLADIASMFGTVAGAVKSLVSYMSTQFGPLFTSLSALAQSFLDVIMEVADIFMTALAPAVNLTGAAIMDMWTYAQPALTKFVAVLKDIIDGWTLIANYLSKNLLPVIKDVFEGWIIIIKSVVDWINRIVTALRTAIALLKQYLGMGGAADGAATGGAHYGAQFKAGEGFATGGAFKVGGNGAGRDMTPVAFRAERGERVTVETKKQQHQADNSNQTTSVNVPVQIVNVTDLSMIPVAMESAAGRRSFLNNISADRDEIVAILGVR